MICQPLFLQPRPPIKRWITRFFFDLYWLLFSPFKKMVYNFETTFDLQTNLLAGWLELDFPIRLCKHFFTNAYHIKQFSTYQMRKTFLQKLQIFDLNTSKYSPNLVTWLNKEVDIFKGVVCIRFVFGAHVLEFDTPLIRPSGVWLWIRFWFPWSLIGQQFLNQALFKQYS